MQDCPARHTAFQLSSRLVDFTVIERDGEPDTLVILRLCLFVEWTFEPAKNYSFCNKFYFYETLKARPRTRKTQQYNLWLTSARRRLSS